VASSAHRLAISACRIVTAAPGEPLGRSTARRRSTIDASTCRCRGSRFERIRDTARIFRESSQSRGCLLGMTLRNRAGSTAFDRRRQPPKLATIPPCSRFSLVPPCSIPNRTATRQGPSTLRRVAVFRDGLNGGWGAARGMSQHPRSGFLLIFQGTSVPCFLRRYSATIPARAARAPAPRMMLISSSDG
jgi:hypothetical protein